MSRKFKNRKVIVTLNGYQWLTIDPENNDVDCIEEAKSVVRKEIESIVNENLKTIKTSDGIDINIDDELTVEYLLVYESSKIRFNRKVEVIFDKNIMLKKHNNLETQE